MQTETPIIEFTVDASFPFEIHCIDRETKETIHVIEVLEQGTIDIPPSKQTRMKNCEFKVVHP